MKTGLIFEKLLLIAVLAAVGVAPVSGASAPDSNRDPEANVKQYQRALDALLALRDDQTDRVVLSDAQTGEDAASGPEGEGTADGQVAPGPSQEERPVRVSHRIPLRTGGIRAPRPGRPSPNPLARMDRRTLQSAITRPLEFGEPALGFVPPDWTEPLRDIEADSMVTNLATNETVLTSNVRLRLGAMLFRSDEFRYTEELGYYEATGSVLVQQHESQLTADKLTYIAPEPELVERTFVLEPGPDEQQFARRRLTMGRLLAENLHVVEPTREMFAEYVDYDFASQTGELRNAQGIATVFYYNAGEVHIHGPEDAIIKDVWFTTCPLPNPFYRINVNELTIRGKDSVVARGARLQIGRHKTPIYVPFWRGGEDTPYTLDYESGRRAAIGYYTNLGLQFEVSPEVSAGPRIMPTHKAGIGLGGDVHYDFTRNPSSYLYRTQGEAHVLHTTKDRGYGLWRHRYEYDNDLVLRMETEQWSDREFFKDFFYDDSRNRTTPRTFANVTWRQPDFIATGTTRVNTHSWIDETGRLPEASFHLIERPLVDNFYLSFDTVTGYNRHKRRDQEGARTVNIARLTYALDLHPSVGITPFYEAEGAWYQRTARDGGSATRFSNTVGVTAQTRFHKVYPGMLGFSAFKHVVAPSVTYSYRPKSSLSQADTPRFDALDNVVGRSRIETKLNNVVYARDADTGETWQAARLTLYQGNDFWNESRKAEDYEVEMDIRPRPWWGAQLVAESHTTSKDQSLFDGDPVFYRRWFYKLYDRLFDRPFNEEADEYRRSNADFNRLLTQVYYDNTMLGGKYTGRLGFAYTDSRGRAFNRELLYGLGYRVNDNWGFSFEHIYNIKDGYMRSQTYELRRRFDCWESALRFRDRESGFDVNVEFSLVAFPGTTIKF